MFCWCEWGISFGITFVWRTSRIFSDQIAFLVVLIQQLKFFYFPERCDIPLGSEDGRLPDVSFTASSIYNAHYAAYQGRLNAMRSGSRYGSWIARYNNRRQWFQIDLGNRAIVIKIGIQGRYDANQWVKSFTVSYGMNGFHFRFYKEGGRTRVCETTIEKFSLVRGILLMNARAII